MKIELRDTVALVTGASRGIGAATARAFSAAGAAVALVARDEQALDRLAQEIRGGGGDAIALATDVRDERSVEGAIGRTLAEYGRLDFACNNAAQAGQRPTPLADVTAEQFDEGLAISLRGVFLCMRQEIPAMLQNAGGAIVNVSSTAGQQAVAGLAGYVTAKHGVEGLTKTAALDYAEQKIRVNAVAPGPVLTGRLAGAPESAREAAAAAMPVKRVAEPHEIADAIVWLCSGQASYVTGATLLIDGGKLAGMQTFDAAKRDG
jgi:NAD(P)-dependent dehydrogenase (short-subunit alcohol dehydrogenase family)